MSIPRISQIVGKQNLVIEDICQVYCISKSIESRIRNLEILQITNHNPDNYTVSIMEIIQRILKEEELKDVTVSWIGEKNVLIEYLPVLKKQNKFLEYIIVAFVSSVIFFGSMVALMSFQVETNITKLVEETLEILVGDELTNSNYVSIPYAIGITTGIIVFFNHFGGKKITTDPTPIEIEMLNFDINVAMTANEQLELDKRQMNEEE